MAEGIIRFRSKAVRVDGATSYKVPAFHAGHLVEVDGMRCGWSDKARDWEIKKALRRMRLDEGFTLPSRVYVFDEGAEIDPWFLPEVEPSSRFTVKPVGNGFMADVELRVSVDK